MGVDASSNAGIVVLEEGNDVPLHAEVFKTPGIKTATIPLSIKHRDNFRKRLEQYRPDLIVFEEYGFASQSLAYTVAIGTQYRTLAHECNYPWTVAAPTILKKFLLGKGQGDKNVILLEVFKQYGYDTREDGEADAYTLAKIGLVIAGKETVTKAKQEAVAKVVCPELPALTV